MYQRRDYRDDEQITVGFKASGKLATAVHEAAERAGFPSTTQWLRGVAIHAAAEALGVTVASLEPAPKRRLDIQPGPSPAAAAGLASANAALLDAEVTIKRLADALKLVAGQGAPTPPARPSRRR